MVGSRDDYLSNTIFIVKRLIILDKNMDEKEALKLLRNLIDRTLEASRKKRIELFRDPNSTIINIEVYLSDKQAAINYFNEIFNHLNTETSSEVKRHFQAEFDKVLNQMPGTPSIARLERLLNEVRRHITLDLIGIIIEEIEKDKDIIEDISDRIQISIDRLNDAAKIFGIIAVILNVATGIVTLSTGNIAGILKILEAIE